MEGLDEASSVQRTATYVTAAILVTALIFLSLTAIFVTRGVTRPVAEAARIAGALTEGDLTVRAMERSEDEIGHMLEGLDQLARRLKGILSDVHQGSDCLSTAAQQLANSSQALSQGTSEQAAAVEQTSASLEQMNASINENAGNSLKLEEMALKGVSDAEASGTAVLSPLR